MKRIVIAITLTALILFGASWGLKGIAAQNAQEEHLWLMQTLLPGAESFTLEPYSGEDANIRSIHKSDNGYVIETVTNGYADEITMVIGVSNEGKVTGLVVLEAHETPGLGNEVLTDHGFLCQFLNRTCSLTIGSSDADALSGATAEAETGAGEEITVDGITGATVSSKAVARCVNSAVAYVTGADAVSAATSWGG